jgi:two-component sensor histidine kinase/putative methionine-R-sulfoxide reductase with GAF domain
MPKRNLSNADPALAKLFDYQRALASFSQVASGELPPQRLLHHATAQVSRLTHIKHVKVMRYRPDKADLLIEAGVGWKPGVVGTVSLAIDLASPAGHAIQTAAPVIIEDLPNDPGFRYAAVLQEHGIISVLNVPVQIDGKTWGVLEVDADEPRTFDEGDVGFLTTMANILGMALRRYEADKKVLVKTSEHARELAQAEVLLQELRHRVKNNFQTIIAFLSHQRRLSSPAVRERLQSVMDRVQAIALAHDQLSDTQGGSEVEFGGYLRALCANIDPHREGVRIEVEASGSTVPLDRAVPAGLIVNELVTNSVKYAFDEGGGTVRVTFLVDPGIGEGCVMVEDDGKGMGPPREGGLGLTLIDALAAQLGGRVQRHEVEKGTRTGVCFPTAL